MALPTRRRRPGALRLLLLLVGLALAAAISSSHAVRVPAAALQHGDTEAAHKGQAPAAAGSGTVPPLEHADDNKQVHERVGEGIMHLSSGSGGSLSSSASSSGSGSRSGGGGSRGGSTNSDDGWVFDLLLDYDDSSAGARGGAWKTGVAATVLAVAGLL